MIIGELNDCFQSHFEMNISKNNRTTNNNMKWEMKIIDLMLNFNLMNSQPFKWSFQLRLISLNKIIMIKITKKTKEMKDKHNKYQITRKNNWWKRWISTIITIEERERKENRKKIERKQQ